MVLKVRSDDGIVWMMLANPPVNAVTRAMIEQVISVLQRCTDDSSTRVVVLGGEGRHFCAGADLREQQHAWSSGGSGPADLGLDLYTALLEFPKPIVGMAHGAVAGAGLSIISCCDFAIAATETRISLPEINVGVLGGISHARAALGKALVNYMALTGLPIDAERLVNSGLFLEVVDSDALLGRAASIARTIAEKEPEAARYTKRCMRAIEGLDQLQGYAREHGLSEELRASGLTDRLVARFLNR
jgi:enoyl-CoA hydratase/carnithine racemase